jgi:hypothetical protein
MRSAAPLSVLLFVASALNAQKIKTFDVPNGTNTTPTGISTSGEIVGHYNDDQAGFLRDRKGSITKFNCPVDSLICIPTGISPTGQIVGYQFPVQVGPFEYGVESFLRKSNGTIGFFGSTFNEGEGSGLFAEAINPAGEIAGDWTDIVDNNHGFVRTPDGTVTSIDIDPHKFPTPGTFVTAINQAGVIVGWGNAFGVFDLRLHGFIRQVDGTITTFDVLNAEGSFPQAINAQGQIAGYWQDSTSHDHGFVRDVDGNTITVDYPGATETAVLGIDSRGTVAGVYGLSSSDSHAFVRDPDGTFTTIEIPDSTFTTIAGMNPDGDIVGAFFDSSGNSHGWVRTR